MGMTVSKGSGLAYISVDFQFFKEHGRLDGSGFYLDRIGSVAYRIRTLTKTYHVRDRTVSIKYYVGSERYR
jgi:hypothetical protein